MGLKLIGKLSAMLALGGALAGCIDAKVDIEVISDTSAKATITQVMGADFYTMIKQSMDEAATTPGSDGDFCEGGKITENADGSATCVVHEEGPFASLNLGEDSEAVTFAAAGPGLVRVALPTAKMRAEIGADEQMDAETTQMVEAFFTGHSITLTFSGLEVTDTNMTLSADKKSAERVIPFVDLIKGTVELPDEIYAVVRVK